MYENQTGLAAQGSMIGARGYNSPQPQAELPSRADSIHSNISRLDDLASGIYEAASRLSHFPPQEIGKEGRAEAMSSGTLGNTLSHAQDRLASLENRLQFILDHLNTTV